MCVCGQEFVSLKWDAFLVHSLAHALIPSCQRGSVKKTKQKENKQKCKTKRGNDGERECACVSRFRTVFRVCCKRKGVQLRHLQLVRAVAMMATLFFVRCIALRLRCRLLVERLFLFLMRSRPQCGRDLLVASLHYDGCRPRILVMVEF